MRTALSRLKIGASVLLWMAGASCDDTVFGAAESNLYVSCERDPPLDYENFGKGFLKQHCTGCHSSLVREEQRNYAPVDVDFDTYDGLLEWASDAYQRTVDERSMPPSGGPRDEEVLRFAEWMQCQVLPDAAQGE